MSFVIYSYQGFIDHLSCIVTLLGIEDILEGNVVKIFASIYFVILLYLGQKNYTVSTPVLLPGKSHGQRSLVGYSPWGSKESDTTERLHFTADEKLTVHLSNNFRNHVSS